MEIKTRKYAPEDYDFVYQLKKECYYPYVSQIWGWDEKKQLDYFSSFINNAEDNMNIICADGRPIGMVNWNKEADTFELENICLLPEYRNHGIGSRLLKEIIKNCGYSKIRLQAFKTNPVIHLYRRLGFVIDGETQNHVRMLFISGLK